MTTEKLQYFKDKLITLKKELIENLNEKYNDVLDFNSDGGKDAADEAYNIYNRNLMLGKVETDALKLQLVEQALQRIEKGTFGICMECEDDIQDRRLDIVPFGRYCIDCKTEMEKKGLVRI